MAVEKWGEFEGEPVGRVVLDNGKGLRAAILSWGGVLQSLTIDVDGRPRPLVLGFDGFPDYPAKSPYFGATVGRFGNRIGHATFTLDGMRHDLEANMGGVHHLHGGSKGWGRRLWRMTPGGDGRSVTLELTGPAGEAGYPGTVEARCLYQLTDDSLDIEMTATTTAPTPINMVHHTYWNLDGKGSIEAHELRLAADGYLPTGEGQIPTGEIRPVAGTGFDFREARRIDAKGTADYDHCFVVNGSGLRPVADLVASDGRVRMTLDADQPGVQLYTGFKMDITASDGAHIGPRAGLCLETECFPDAPNKPEFPSSILRPNETYRHRMVHRFAVAGA
jgi:aldose 1-epimerase